MWVWGVLEPSRKFGGVPERPWRVQGVLLLIHGVHGFIQKGLEMSKKVPVGCRGSPGVSRASLQSSRRVWGCPRTVLECPGSVHVGLGGPGAIQKGLEMSQRGLGGSGGSFGGFRGSCCLLEGSEDVPEVSWGVQGVLPLSLPLSYEGTKGPPWGHCVKVGDTVSSLRTSQGKWGHRVTVSHLKVGDTPTVSHLKVGASLCPPDGVRPQSWGHTTVSHPKVGDTPTCYTPKLGSVPEVGVPPRPHHGVTSQSWGPPSGDPFCAPPIADCTVPMGWERGAPFIFGIKVYFVITGGWGMPPLRE